VYDLDKPSQTIESNETSTSSPKTTNSPPGRRAGQLVLGKLLSIIGRVLLFCGAAMALVVCLLPFLRLYSLLPEQIAVDGFFLPLLATGLAGAAVVLGLKIQWYSKRLRSRSAELVLTEDLRDPVVYLRPFAADEQSTANRVVWTLSARSLIRRAVTPALTDEEQLAMALNVFGPTIAVASPEETLPPAGIPRLRLTTSHWQEQVNALLKRARLVVIQCGVSRQGEGDEYWPTSRVIEGGFRWELTVVVAEVPPERLVLLLPFDGLEYENFCWKAKDIFPCSFPPYWKAIAPKSLSRALMWFDTNWSPFLAPITWVDHSFRLDTLSPLVTSLRSKFQAVIGGGFDLRYGGSKLGKRLIAVLIDLLFSFLLTTLLTLVLAAQLGLTEAALNKVLVVLLPLVACTYSTLFEASALMATIGKFFMGLMVVDINGRRLSPLNALRRTATKIFLLPVTWIPALFATDRQTLHERWSSSTVALGALRVREPSRLFAVVTYLALGMTYLLAYSVIIPHRSPLYFPRDTDRVELTFQSVKGFIVMPAVINNQPLTLLLSTTVATTAINRSAARRLGIKSFYKTEMITLKGRHTQEDLSVACDLKLASLLLTNIQFVISDRPAVGADVGVQIDGVIGYDLLSRGIVQVDYASRKLIIVKARYFHYDGSGESIPIAIDRRMPSVVAAIKVPGQNVVNDTFWLNPGVPGGVNHPLIRRSTSARTVWIRSLKSDFTVGKIEYIQLGKIRLEGLLSACCTGVDQMDRLIGSAALSQFEVIFDYPHGRVILDPRDVVRSVLKP
jgi:uncharacterized RDD family membrane protein YckC